MSEESKESIVLVQKPIIEHRLKEIGLSVTKRIEAQNLEAQLVTEQTVQSLKDVRADLNKESKLFADQFKALSEKYMEPLNAVKEVYKLEIAEKYANAETILKTKIGEYELKIKTDKRNAVQSYFNELCIAEKIDFVKFEHLQIEINLSTTEKKYKEQCLAFITKVVDDIKLINASAHQAETMVEYKKTLNASKAITMIKERKEAEEKEAARVKAEQNTKRQNECKALGMVWVDIVNCYDFDSNISISKDQIETLSVDDFNKLIAETKIKIDATKVVEPTRVQVSTQSEMMNTIFDAPTAPIKEQPAAPIEAPKVIEPVKTMIAKFEVSGTREQLLALGQYMKSNNIHYKNLE